MPDSPYRDAGVCREKWHQTAPMSAVLSKLRLALGYDDIIRRPGLVRRTAARGGADDVTSDERTHSESDALVPDRSPTYSVAMDYRERITIEPGKRGGKPCIRGMRITVYDVLDYLAGGMTEDEILADFPYLEREDIRAVLAFAADRERRLIADPAA